MKIGAAVLTWNPIRNGRLQLLHETLESLWAEADTVRIVDNGSTDGFAGGDWKNTGRNTTSGFGTYSCVRLVGGMDVDICVVSDDDMVWKHGWADRLRAFWAGADDNVLLAGGHLEPIFFWNTVAGHEPGVIWRESTGAASWTFRHADYERLVRYCAMVDMGIQGVWDVPVCQRIRRDGFRIGQLDLAEHVGDRSTWGNETVGHYGWDVEPVRELIR